MTDDQIKDAILNAVRATVVALHTHSRGLASTDPQQIERDAFWLAGKCEEAAKRAMEGR